MADPIRSKGALPKRWKRRQHAERQARLERTAAVPGNPVRILAAPELDDSPRAFPCAVIRPATADHGIAETESARTPARWNAADGKLLHVDRLLRCSACSAVIRPGAAAWFNPYAKWWTCTTCTPVTHPA